MNKGEGKKVEETKQANIFLERCSHRKSTYLRTLRLGRTLDRRGMHLITSHSLSEGKPEEET